MIKGNLSSFSLGEIFQSLAVNNHTGTLKILEKTGEEKYLYFSKGEICLFSSKANPSLRIGEILLRENLLRREDLEQALALQRETSDRLGKILTTTFGVPPDQVQQALETKLREEIYDLFLLNDAEFEFFVDYFPEDRFDSIEPNVHISVNTTSVLMEGLRLADEWRIISQKISTFNEIFARTESAAEAVPDGAQEEYVLKRVDGATPVRRIFDGFPGCQFDCCKTIFEFLGAGTLRSLSLAECREQGELRAKAGDLEKAIDFLQFAVQLAPDRPEPLVLCGNLLHRVERTEEADPLLLKAVEIYFERGELKEVLKIGQPLIERSSGHEPLLKAVFQAALQQGNRPLIAACGDDLGTLLISKGAKDQAAEVLLKVSEHFPKEVGRRLMVADLLKGQGEIERATAKLEETLALIRGNQYLSEQIKVLRQLYEMAPERRDLKQEINSLLALRERIEARKKRQFTLVGVSSILLVLLMVFPILYEVKARELLSHAMRLEQISLTSGNFEVAKRAYAQVVKNFKHSTRTSDAEIALARLRDLERARQQEADSELKRTEELQFNKIHALQQEVRALLEKAQAHEKRGELAEAFSTYQKIIADFPDTPQAKEVLLPLKITSSPQHCTVSIDGRKVGETPLVLRSRPGEHLALVLTRLGCESSQRDITVGEVPSVHFEMKLRPLAEFTISGPVQATRTFGDDIFFPSRDGFFYSVNPNSQTVNWRRKVGRYGDRTSDPNYDGVDEILHGTVSGEVAAFSRHTGKARWRTSVESPVLARPALSADKRWVAVGDLDGKLTLINNVNGKVVGSFQTENEIVRAPAFWNYLVVAASEDNNLYLLSIPESALLHSEFLSHEATSDLLVHQDLVFFTTSNGLLHAYDPVSRNTKWTREFDAAPSTDLTVYGKALLCGTVSGEVHATGIGGGNALWKVQASESPLGDFLLARDRLYFGTLGGEITEVHLGNRTVEWTFHSDQPISIAPAAIGPHLYVAASSGKFFIMEVFY